MANDVDWGELRFEFPFRKYQAMILEALEKRVGDHKFHIVAPPGSGKTIVGLELIKRWREPAVVFAPTSTIVEQWKEKWLMFLEDEKLLNDWVSTDPEVLRPINLYTYQLISSPGENLQFVEEAAVGNWVDQMVEEGLAGTVNEAARRIKLLKTQNPPEYRKELARHYKRMKDYYLYNHHFDGSQFLHANARKLIERLVKYKVKTVVMDEAHHLLDYWAVVLKVLLRKLDQPRLVGLTATPPLSADEEEIQNYLSILGEVDFEIPTPAVVKEGNLAPYQDLVYFCTPTVREKEFINSLEHRFVELVNSLSKDVLFKQWFKEMILERKNEEGKRISWEDFLDRQPRLAIAAGKLMVQVWDMDLEAGMVWVEEMDRDMEIEDWVELLNNYCINYLQLDVSREEQYEQIKRVLKGFGFTLTGKGIRQFRSPADLVLALSENKSEAVVEILRTEMDAMGEKLRAVVIADFEKQSAAVAKYVGHVLDEEAGGAVRLFKKIVHDVRTTKLEPVLVTGTTVLLDVDELEVILPAMKDWIKKNDYSLQLKTQETVFPHIVQLLGSGKDWKSSVYVRMVTDLFDQGVIKCIVGTRGLLGEGWDSLGLNTLLDLTSVTTSMSVNQIRGRSIRLDPESPRKVANNWDVVCIDPEFEQGNHDFERFLKKHRQFYGLGSKGKIVKGFYHVDESLALQYNTIGFKRITYPLVNRRMLEKAKARDEAYEGWRIGQPYKNVETAASKLEAKGIDWQAGMHLRNPIRRIFDSIFLGSAGAGVWYYLMQVGGIGLVTAPGWGLILPLMPLGFVALAGWNVYRLVTTEIKDVPQDKHLEAMGLALLQTMKALGLVDGKIPETSLRVSHDGYGNWDVYLTEVSSQDGQAFSRAINELLGPVVNQRYLVSRSVDGLWVGIYSPLWWLLRKLFRLMTWERVAFHPVPADLAINKKSALMFAKYWRQCVGGGQLVYTRSEKGARALLKIRSRSRLRVNRVSYDLWS